jgi:Ca2+/H+ antiporter, TMEM165/GDT1 family
MSIEWTRIGPPVTAAFLGSLVEFIEALTIVIAVGTVRGWRSAMLGTSMGVLLLAALVILLGPALGLIPITLLQLAVGVLLLLFGMRWLRKAILREAGIIPLHDEAQAYARETEALGGTRFAGANGWDAIAIATAFKAVVLEGLEVVFIVIAVGAVGHMLIPASAGAVAAGIVVVLFGLALRRPLARVPENTLKFAVGILISAFGVFWVGEGLGFHWPGSDLSILGLTVGLLLISLVMVPLVRHRPPEESAELAPAQQRKESY